MNLKEKNSIFGFQLNKAALLCILFAIFVAALAVRYYPIYQKGAPWSINADNLILARNLHLANEYSFQDDKNIVLNSSLVAEKGIAAETPNRLTSVIYAKIFNVFGFRPMLPVYISIFLFALTNVFLFFIVKKLFGLGLALIFSATDIFMPFVLAGSNWAGFYEWGMLFFVLGLFFFFFAYQKERLAFVGAKRYLFLFLAGVCLALAVLCRNAFLISVIPIIIFDFYQQRSFKRAAVLILPIGMILATFFFPGYYYQEENSYLTAGRTSAYDGHLFPDPYTFHYERESFIERIKETAQGDQINALSFYGYTESSFWQESQLRWLSLVYYLENGLSSVTFGGVLSLFLLIVGAWFLWEKKRDIFKLVIFWPLFVFACLIFLKTTNSDHFLEVRFALVLLISLGLFRVLKIVIAHPAKEKTKKLLGGVLVLAFVLYLAQGDKWMLHEKYENSSARETILAAQEIRAENTSLSVSDVWAVEGTDMTALTFAYFTNFSTVNFNGETIDFLVRQQTLKDAFKRFGVTHFLSPAAYGPQIAETGVMVVGTN